MSMPSFDAPDARYIGRRDGDVIRVSGIRYASAERFRRPVPVAPASKPVLAIRPAPACPQPPWPFKSLLGDLNRGVVFDEECQHLSVTLPDGARPGARLPVMVWIHGGSYVYGGGDLPIYDPSALVREQGVVVVAVTYRLGILGFLGRGDDVPANLGLLDQIEALRWVGRNIGAFGGDPSNVTLFGQSAGGDAIAHLLISEGTAGLLKRVIIQSAPFGVRTDRRGMTERMVEAAGRPARDASLEELLVAQGRAERAARGFGYRSGMPFGLQYGRAPLPPEEDATAAWRAAAPGLDVLVGWTREEMALYLAVNRPARALLALPAVGRLAWAAAVRVSTDAVCRRPGHRFAEMLAQAGARVTEYEFDWRPVGSKLGACHCLELPLLFPSRTGWANAEILGDTSPESLESLGAAVRKTWADFARSGVVAAAASRRPHEPYIALRSLTAAATAPGNQQRPDATARGASKER